MNEVKEILGEIRPIFDVSNFPILIVDDEPDAIEFVKAVLSDIGEFHIISAKDGKEGINKAVTDKPDLIILDVIMPGMDGFLVFHELRNSKETTL